MCDGCSSTTEAPRGYIGGGQSAEQLGKSPNPKEDTLRDRLESLRNRLTRKLAQCEVALQLIYTNPDAEKIHDILSRSGI